MASASAFGLGEGADILFDAVVVDLKVGGLEIGDGVALFVEGDDVHVDEAGIEAEGHAGGLGTGSLSRGLLGRMGGRVGKSGGHGCADFRGFAVALREGALLRRIRWLGLRWGLQDSREAHRRGSSSAGAMSVGWACGQGGVGSYAGGAFFIAGEDAGFCAEEMVLLEVDVIEEHLARAHGDPGVAAGVLQVAEGFGHGDGDAAHGADVGHAAQFHGAVFDRGGGAGDGIGRSELGFDGEAGDDAVGWIDGDFAVIGAHLLEHVALEAVGLGDAAVADFIVRAVFGDGVVEDGERAAGTLLPVRPGELVLGGVDEHEAEDGAEGAPGPEPLVGGATVLDFDGGCLDDFLAVAIEHGSAGDAVGVKGVAFFEATRR